MNFLVQHRLHRVQTVLVQKKGVSGCVSHFPQLSACVLGAKGTIILCLCFWDVQDFWRFVWAQVAPLEQLFRPEEVSLTMSQWQSHESWRSESSSCWLIFPESLYWPYPSPESVWAILLGPRSPLWCHRQLGAKRYLCFECFFFWGNYECTGEGREAFNNKMRVGKHAHQLYHLGRGFTQPEGEKNEEHMLRETCRRAPNSPWLKSIRIPTSRGFYSVLRMSSAQVYRPYLWDINFIVMSKALLWAWYSTVRTYMCTLLQSLIRERSFSSVKAGVTQSLETVVQVVWENKRLWELSLTKGFHLIIEFLTLKQLK